VDEKCERKAEAGEKAPEEIDSVGEGGPEGPGSAKKEGEVSAETGGIAWWEKRACREAAGGM